MAESTYSGANGGECVEWSPATAQTHGPVPIRDGKNPHGPVLTISPSAWHAFIAYAATGHDAH
ncbi:DUF397 domain-containing protein [Streptomyces sp. NPDC050610]|uniref:DUF397 domain-containing protein n=1 Tax=Streptomyces sp. NPDC050610 TaxID=3157097 RepID=UPI00342B847C